MKKVLILAAAIALFATPSFAAISGSKHDLSSVTGAANTVKGDSNETCVYCHTPHGGLTGGFAPLWNRNNGSNPTGFYASGSLDATVGNAGILTSDALLCLSCHDGASLTSGLRNEPNSGTVTVSGAMSAGTNLTLDMTNDHPVGFVYSTSSTDTEITAAPTAPVYVNFGASSNEMWCSSCHDVHDATNAPFLVMSNSGSALCLKCHIK